MGAGEEIALDRAVPIAHPFRTTEPFLEEQAPMKAMIIEAPGGLDRLKLVDRPDPGQPGPGQIRVALHGSSLNFHDYLVCCGKSPTADGRVPMADGAGVVEAIGAGVTDFAPGDAVVSCFFPDWQDGAPKSGDFRRVPGDGIDGFAIEAVVAPATAFTRAPAGYSAEEAATITTAGLTAWRALVCNGGLKAGDSVLALGGGGVSIWALQIARAMGARRLLATSSSDAKLERFSAMGAEATINYRTRPDWGVAMREETGGRGVDHVIEVGGPGTLPQSIEAARIGRPYPPDRRADGTRGRGPDRQAHGQADPSRRPDCRPPAAGLCPRDRGDGIQADNRPLIPARRAAGAFRYEELGRHFGKICVGW